MLDLHIIGTKRAKQAIKSNLNLHLTTNKNGCVSTRAQFFCDYLKRYLLDDPALGKTAEERKHQVFGGGLTIQSTVDLRFQRAADNAVTNAVYPKDQAVGAMAMVEPGTGYVRALAQSRPMGNNHALGQTFLNFTVPTRYGDAPGFRAGSTFKLFVLAAAISQGIPLNKTIYSPGAYPAYLGGYRTCTGNYPSTETFTFHNSTESGNKDMYSGMQESVNTFFVQLEKMTGLCAPWELARKMGVELDPTRGEPNPDRVPSSTLGVSDVSPLEMAEAYATMANRGVHCDSTPITEIRDRNGDDIPIDGPQCQRVVKPAVADAVNDILKGVMEPGGFGQDIALNQPSAGKTGTVAPSYSVWFIGYTPTLATSSMIAGVQPDGDPKNLDYTVLANQNVGDVHGSTTAGPMWGAAMRAIEQWLPDENFVSPDPSVIEGQTVSIPSFYGQSPEAAAQQLTQLGFNPQIVSYSVNSSAPEGTVAYTSPSYEGTSGETVSIYVSNGYVPPPPTQQRRQQQQRRRQQPWRNGPGDGPEATARRQRSRRQRSRRQRARRRQLTQLPSYLGRHGATVGAALDLRGDGAHHATHRLHPVVADTELVDRRGDQRRDLVVAHRLGQELPDDRRLGALLRRQLTAAGVVEGGGRLAPLLALGGEHGRHVVVAELAGLLAGDLGVRDRGEDHPEGRRTQLVARLHRRRQLRTQLVLELSHGPSLWGRAGGSVKACAHASAGQGLGRPGGGRGGHSRLQRRLRGAGVPVARGDSAVPSGRL